MFEKILFLCVVVFRKYTECLQKRSEKNRAFCLLFCFSPLFLPFCFNGWGRVRRGVTKDKTQFKNINSKVPAIFSKPILLSLLQEFIIITIQTYWPFIYNNIDLTPSHFKSFNISPFLWFCCLFPQPVVNVNCHPSTAHLLHEH